MDEHQWLAERFEDQRGHLRAVAYRMLGSLSEADDAVQEAWLHVSRADASGVENLAGWLTTIVARVCLDMLRSRKARREEPMNARLPDPIVSRAEGVDPEQEVLLADSIGLALLVVLDMLSPTERVAFVLHDVFGVPFEAIASIVDRSPVAARQLASRARRRVRGAAPESDADLGRQRAVVDAFLAAARGGEFEALLAVLDPEVVLRADRGAQPPAALVEIRGAPAVAEQAIAFARRYGPSAQRALVNGAPGVVARGADGRLASVLGFTVAGGRILEIDILGDPARLDRLDVAALDGR